MRTVNAVMVVTLLAAAYAPSGSAIDMLVEASCNIYGAGHLAPDDTPTVGHGGGIPPERISLDQLGNPPIVTLQVAGSISYCPSCGLNGPDGTASQGDAPSYNGISGISNAPSRSLRAVFTGEAEPVDPAPPALDFALIGADYTRIAPEVAQMFFIGNGLAGPDDQPQLIRVPEGATALYLGFVDGNGYDNTPGWYEDNSGSVTATISVPLSLRINMSSGQAHISVYGEVGTTNRVEYTPVLPAIEWTPLTNVVLEVNPTPLDDATTSGASARFYRAVRPR